MKHKKIDMICHFSKARIKIYEGYFITKFIIWYIIYILMKNILFILSLYKLSMTSLLRLQPMYTHYNYTYKFYIWIAAWVGHNLLLDYKQKYN